MSYIESQLQPGEQVFLRINRHNKWYHYILLVITYCLVLPILLWVIGYFFFHLFAAFLSESSLILIGSGLLLLLGLGGID